MSPWGAYVLGVFGGFFWGAAVGAFVLRPWLERMVARTGMELAARMIAKSEGCSIEEARVRATQASRKVSP
jgi:hypothetical protein